MPVVKVTRRRLLVGAAGTAVVAGGAGLWLAVGKLRNRRWSKPVEREGAFAPSVYLAIDEDDSVTIWLTKSEMGQGVMTALPMLVAEELDADWSRVRVEQVVLDGHYDYGKTFTAASSSVTSLWVELRRAGAAAREMLVTAAAKRWDVAPDECSTERGVVSCGERTLSYGALAKAAALESAPLRPKLKERGQFRLIGTNVGRVELEDKSTGRAVFGLDVRERNDTVRVALRRCPVLGGKLERVSEEASLRIPGVIEVVKLEGAVAVVADTTWAAIEGARLLEPEWTLPPRAREPIVLDPTTPGQTVHEVGSGGPAVEGKSFEAIYRLPFLAHATMEPPNCTIDLSSDRCEAWIPTQDPEGARRVVSQVTGLPEARVTVHRTLLGGGFGRRTMHTEVREAATVAKLLKRPLQVVWSREDDIRHDFYREASAHRLRATLDETAKIDRWLHRIVTATSPSASTRDQQAPATALMGATDLPYVLPNAAVEWIAAERMVATGIWRAVGHSYNAFAVESFIDELAASADADPIAFRLALLPNGHRLIRCIARVRELSGWPGPADASRSLGLAASACFGSYVAQVAQVSRNAGVLRVERVWCALDCGTVVNPDTVRAQIESGIVFGLTAALHGRIRVVAGAVQEATSTTTGCFATTRCPRWRSRSWRAAKRQAALANSAFPASLPPFATPGFGSAGSDVASCRCWVEMAFWAG